jgi:succinoglycan biosynthesis protein ExoA
MRDGQTQRRVSVVIAALNESRYIEDSLRSILAQVVDRDVEVIVVDGCSDDDTASRAKSMGAIVIENPRRSIPAALNVGLRAASGDILVRVDAHAEIPPGYIQSCLKALEEEPGCVNVGGWREAIGFSPFGRAVAAALASPFGVGNPRIWRRPSPGEPRRDVETVPLGCFPVEAIRDVDGWREDLLANEDFELNHRLRRRGGRVVFDPAITSIYRPRETLTDVARQYWRYGQWKAAVLAESPDSLRARQLAPLALLATCAGAPFLRSARAGAALYTGLVCVAAARSGGGWRTVPVLATMHLSWGSGFVRGLPRALSARAVKS